MGSSIWLIVLVPLLFIYSIFANIHSALFGDPTARISLPYDEENGQVWSYDGENDPYLTLIETKFENGEQIFVFEGSEGEDENKSSGSIMKLIFTDVNGNEKIYYGYHSGKFNPPHFYSEDECQTLDITLSAKKPKANAHWKITDGSRYILIQETDSKGTGTFTAVFTPFNEAGYPNIDFTYVGFFGNELELATALCARNDGIYTVENIYQKTAWEDFIDSLF
ncbi:MAG: hypothetical protein IJ261_00890 [Clostridia bacterium]|nr:hypothetical protein [Clostridia bacterium]